MLNITEEELAAMAAVDVRTVDISTLTDIRDIKIDTKLPVEEKLASFARQTNNILIVLLFWEFISLCSLKTHIIRIIRCFFLTLVDYIIGRHFLRDK